MNEGELKAGLPGTPQYKYAERVGNQLFIAGQVPHDAEGQLVGSGDPYAQSKQCLENLDKLLSVHGFAKADTRRIVIYVVGDHGDLVRAWDAVKIWFSEEVPPATLLGVAKLGHFGQSVEIDATIIKA